MVVCIEVLRPSQPNGTMSSAVNLPNHTFTVQAFAWNWQLSFLSQQKGENDGKNI